MINVLIPKKKKNKTSRMATPNKPFPNSFSINFIAFRLLFLINNIITQIWLVLYCFFNLIYLNNIIILQ